MKRKGSTKLPLPRVQNSTQRQTDELKRGCDIVMHQNCTSALGVSQRRLHTGAAMRERERERGERERERERRRERERGREERKRVSG